MNDAERTTLERLRAASGSGDVLERIRLVNCDLSRQVLPDLGLENFEFGGSLFRGANLAGLRGVDGDLVDADLTGASLVGAVLHDCVLSRAVLRGADCTGTVIAVCFCVKTSFRECNLTDAVLDGSTFDDGDFRDAVLVGASAKDALFADADLSGADLRNARLPGADFRGAKLDGANFDGADLTGALFDPK